MRTRGGGPGRPRRGAAARVGIAVLGGGNGISAVLRGLARRVRAGERLRIRAVVATADDGGSSGRLRRDRGGLPPGDLRNCLLALAPGSEAPFERLFSHRYLGAGDLAGHSLGNLVLAALAEQEGSYLAAVKRAGQMLRCAGEVLPVSLQAVRLEGEARDGTRLSGESTIGKSHCAVERVWLDPAGTPAAPGVLESIEESDLVVLGPGSLFTSLLAVVLIPGVAEAIRASRGRRVLVANLMTQPGETLGMSLADHLEALDRHVGPGLVECIVADDSPIDAHRLAPYLAQGAAPIPGDLGRGSRSERLVRGRVITAEGKIRHDPDALTASLLSLLAGEVGHADAPSGTDPGVRGGRPLRNAASGRSS